MSRSAGGARRDTVWHGRTWRVLAEKPELLVVGTEYYGRMQVPEETLDALRGAGIDVRVEKTSSAVEEYNRLQRECARIAAALHLTC
jgi:hypothetical protein